jgi:hypothetical protein
MGRIALLLAVLLMLGETAVAQTSTGRHRPDRTAPEPERPSFDEQGARWSLQVGAGLMAAGDLVRVRTAGASAIPWDPPASDPFTSESMALTLDESIVVQAGLGHRVTSRLWLRASIGLAQLDVAVRARIGQTAEVFRWDQIAVLTAGLDAEYRLVRDRSYPYVVAGVGAVRLTAEGDAGLDDTSLALRYGAGYHQHLGPRWGLRLEVRDSLAAYDLDGYRPPVVGGTVYPDATITDAGRDHFWEIAVAMQTVF